VAAIPSVTSATSPVPEAAVESSRSAAARAGEIAPPRRQHLGLHGDPPRLDALVAALRAADTDEDEDDDTAQGPGAVERARLGADRIGQHRTGDEAPLLKVGSGPARSPSSLKKLQVWLRSRWSAASGPAPERRRTAFLPRHHRGDLKAGTSRAVAAGRKCAGGRRAGVPLSASGRAPATDTLVTPIIELLKAPFHDTRPGDKVHQVDRTPIEKACGLRVLRGLAGTDHRIPALGQAVESALVPLRAN
jgi:hypothetical protein